MRYRLMATYQGVPYEAGIGPSDGDVVLFAACPPPEELGYWEVDRGVFELVTPRDEVAEVTEERSDYPGQATGPADQPRPAPGYGPAADYDPATADYGPAMAGYAHSGTGYGPGADYGPATADFGPVTADFAARTTAGPAAAPIPPDFGASTADGRLASPAAT